MKRGEPSARKQVRCAARSLRRKGLADYCRGLFSDDGNVAGAGYGCTLEGAVVLGLRSSPHYQGFPQA